MSMSTKLFVGLKLGSWTLLFTAFMEILSFQHVTALLHERNGKLLFSLGWVMNIVNNLMIGPLTYYLVSTYVTSKASGGSELVTMASALNVTLGHAVGYWIAHIMMHERYLYLYWIHKFHHRFNKIVIPSSANAVSTAEYVFAYMLPFVFTSLITRPSERSLILSASIVSVCNIAVHTPILETMSTFLPWYLVSTNDHLQHHKIQKTNYAAPTFSVDMIINRLVSFHEDRYQ